MGPLAGCALAGQRVDVVPSAQQERVELGETWCPDGASGVITLP